MTGRILVIRAGALGDVVLTLPAVRALRARVPEKEVWAVGYPEVWEVARPLVDRIESIDLPSLASLFSASPSPRLEEWGQGVDLAVAWTVRDPRAALRAAGVPRVIHASPYPPPGVHAATWLLTALEIPHGADRVQTAPPCVQLGLTAEERHRAQVDLHRIGVGRPAFLHPGAGASWKRWPAQNFALLAAALLERGYDPVLIEGPADRDAVAQVQERVTRCLPVVRERSVRELAALLSQEALFVGNDSGVTHLAAAAGALTLALFGPTDPASWRPLGDVRVLRACTACTVRQGQIRVCDDPACMEGIAVEHVLHLLG